MNKVLTLTSNFKRHIANAKFYISQYRNSLNFPKLCEKKKEKIPHLY